MLPSLGGLILRGGGGHMVTFEAMFDFVSMLVSLVTLTYLIIKK